MHLHVSDSRECVFLDADLFIILFFKLWYVLCCGLTPQHNDHQQAFRWFYSRDTKPAAPSDDVDEGDQSERRAAKTNPEPGRAGKFRCKLLGYVNAGIIQSCAGMSES